MGYGGFEMVFFWYAGYEFQKEAGKVICRIGHQPLLDPHKGGVGDKTKT